MDRVRQLARPPLPARVQEEGHVQPQGLRRHPLAAVDADDAVHREAPQLDDVQRPALRIRHGREVQRLVAHSCALLPPSTVMTWPVT